MPLGGPTCVYLICLEHCHLTNSDPSNFPRATAGKFDDKGCVCLLFRGRELVEHCGVWSDQEERPLPASRRSRLHVHRKPSIRLKTIAVIIPANTAGSKHISLRKSKSQYLLE